MPTSSSSSSSSNLRRPAAPAWVVSSGELEASEPSSSSASRRYCQFDPEKEPSVREEVSKAVFSQLPTGESNGAQSGHQGGSKLTGNPGGDCAQLEDESYLPHFPAILKTVGILVGGYGRFDGYQSSGSLCSERSRGLSSWSRQGRSQVLGCVGIVAPFGHKPEKMTDRFRRGKQGFGGVDFWRGM